MTMCLSVRQNCRRIGQVGMAQSTNMPTVGITVHCGQNLIDEFEPLHRRQSPSGTFGRLGVTRDPGEIVLGRERHHV